jgi:hypothetical protein
MVPLLLLLLNPHIRKMFHPQIRKVHKIFHPHLLLVLKNRKTCIPTYARDTKYSIRTTTSSFSSLWNNKTYTPKRKCSKQSCQSRYIWA